ncbi:unnamed protein product, partial [Brenthis ino]
MHANITDKEFHTSINSIIRSSSHKNQDETNGPLKLIVTGEGGNFDPSRDWEEHRSLTIKDDPTLKQFCSFLSRKADWLVSVEPDANSKSTEPKQSSKPWLSASPSASNVMLSATSMQLATSAHVLLSTAMVNVISATGKKYAARLLLDNGSTANFITQSLSEKLGLSLSGASTKRGSEAWIPGPHQG